MNSDNRLLISILAVILMAFLQLCASKARAEGQAAAMEFRDIPVSRLVQIVYGDVLKRSYIVDDRVSGSVSFFSIPSGANDIQNMLDAYLKSRGVSRSEQGGVSFFHPSSHASMTPDAPAPAAATSSAPSAVASFAPVVLPEHAEVAVYRPKHRSAEFLRSVIQMAGGTVSGEFSSSVSVQGEASASSRIERDVLVYAAPPEKLPRIMALLKEVDKAVGSVSLRAALLEVSTTNESERSFSLLLSLFSKKLGLSYVAGPRHVNAITFKNASIDAALSAIDGDSRFKYLAEPHLRVIDGETAKMTVGTEVPTRGEVSYDEHGNPIQSVIYRTAGVIISVRPRILEDAVQLKVNQQISNFVETSTSNIDSPSILRREVDTVVDARPGELVVLAGLDESKDTHSRSGLFFLPDFLKSSNASESRSQVLLMLQVQKHNEAVADTRPGGPEERGGAGAGIGDVPVTRLIEKEQNAH